MCVCDNVMLVFLSVTVLQTPLHCAILDLKLDIFKLLLSYGADFSKQDGSGLTPLALAENMELDEYVEEMEEEQGDWKGC